MRTFVIINPEAAGGRGLRLWPHLSDSMFNSIGLFDFEFTNAAGAATVLAQDAARNGYERVIAVGGDGTVNEVLNGLFTPEGKLINPDIVLGCLPAGSGKDFWRSLNIPGEIDAALDHLTKGEMLACDIGQISMFTKGGRKMTRYFCNMADVGLGAVVAKRAKKFFPWSQGTLSYFLSTFATYMNWRPETMHITADGKELLPQDLVVALIANGQYYGGGMWIAPDAKLNDGKMELVLIRPVPKHRLLQVIPKLYVGRLESLPEVEKISVRKLTIATDNPQMVTVDGETCGVTPLTLKVLPRVLKVQVG